LVSADQAFQNARRHSGCENTQVEAEAAIRRAISVLLADYLDLFTQFTQDSDFRKCMTSVVLEAIATEQTGVETQRLSGDPPQPQ
jgi:type I restriction enzyme R subunit